MSQETPLSTDCAADLNAELNADLQGTAIHSNLQAEEFERIEDKYFVPLQHQDELLELLYHKSRPSYLTEDTHFLKIESCYYESPEYNSFRDHFLGKPFRYKLRTRTYAPNGVVVDPTQHIELKTKDGETSRKFRFKVEPSDLQRLQDYLPIRMSASLVELNPAIPGEELSRRARHISRLVAENRLSPVCKVTYRRQAFERKGIRVTIDTGIESQILKMVSDGAIFAGEDQVRENAQLMVQRFLQQPFALLEIKHRGVIPKWLERFTQLRTTGKTGFSKYCYSMTSQLLGKGELEKLQYGKN